MPQYKQDDRIKVSARQFRNLSEYIRKSSSALTRAISDDALANVTGVRNRAVGGSYVSHDSLTNREKKRVEQIKNLTPLQRTALICQNSLYGGLYQELNKFLLPRRKLPLKRIRFDSELPRGSQGRALAATKFSIVVKYSSAKRISYSRFPHSLEYRDPKQARNRNSIHWGASKKFKRYAVTNVNVLGQSTSAGRKGTELEGLGNEPIGVKPKSGASKADYVFFKRVGYPGRRNPDRLTIKHRFSVYTHFFQNSGLKRKVLSKVQDDGDAFARAWAKRHGEILTDMTKKIKNDLLKF